MRIDRRPKVGEKGFAVNPLTNFNRAREIFSYLSFALYPPCPLNQHLHERIRQEEERLQEIEAQLERLYLLRDMGLIVSLGQDDFEVAVAHLEALREKQLSFIETLKWL